MGDGARPLSRKIFRSHEDGTPHFFRSRDRLAVARFGSGAWTLEITAGKGPAARAIYAHLPAPAGRVADCARSYIDGSAASPQIVNRESLQRKPDSRITNHLLRRASSFSWMLSNPPLLKTTTTSLALSIGTIRSTIAAASFS
jgi:hypothetical protein